MYIIGESYGGIYVPTLVRELFNKNSSLLTQLRGFAIGDGCMGTDVVCGKPNYLYKMKFFNGHGQFSDKLYD